MACYTLVKVNLEDSAVNRKARVLLNLPLEGELSYADATRVRKEAGILKTRAAMLRLSPNAIVRREGSKLTITVNQ